MATSSATAVTCKPEHAFDRMPVHVAAAYAGPVTVMSLVVETGRQIEDEMLDAGADPEATAHAAAARILDDASKQGTPAELAKDCRTRRR